MKAASGELNLTVITLIAIGAVLAFFFAFSGTITNSIKNTWSNVETGDMGGRTMELNP